ncbi:MAG: hypothetical protein WBL50_24450 [Candidatus Acidiferrum sp.]
MSIAVAPRLAVCPEYQRILYSCQTFLAAWQQQRTRAERDPMAGSRYRIELKRLQDEYSRACAALESHEQCCQTCQYIAKVGGLDFESMANALNR